MPGHHHRAGSLRQSNKKNKRTKSSKRSISRLNGGRVEGRKDFFKQRLVTHAKADRRHIQQQRRDAKRLELISSKRGIDGSAPPPRIVGIVSLGHDDTVEERLRSKILDHADNVLRTFGESANATVSVKNSVHKRDGNLTVLTNSTAFRPHYNGTLTDDDAAIMAALDLCRVCDVLLFVINGNESRPEDAISGMHIGGDAASTMTKKTGSPSSAWDHLISDTGDRILSCLKGQGLPRVITVLVKTAEDPDPEEGDDVMTTQSAKSIRRSNLKRRSDLKKYVSRFANTEFGADNDKVVEVNLTESGDLMDEDYDANNQRPEAHIEKTLVASFVRTLCTISASPSKWVANLPRDFILSDSYEYTAQSKELQITGYIRGLVPLDVNSLIHVPNLGTFHCKRVCKAVPPFHRNTIAKGIEHDMSVVEPNPADRDSLEMFASPDALEGEQNLIGFDDNDDNDVDLENEASSTTRAADAASFARPAGWSDYQSAWLDAVDDISLGADEMDHGELARAMNVKKPADRDAESMELDDANRLSEAERQALLQQRQREQSENQEFPDEVQVRDDEKARDRFARYRSLKSFRKSHWDPKENLPDTYASLFHFRSFKASQRIVMNEFKDLKTAAEMCQGRFWDGKKDSKSNADEGMDTGEEDDEDILIGCIPSGAYVSLTLENVSAAAFESVNPQALLTAVSLLPHENKVCVVHMGLTQSSNCDVDPQHPVKNKDTLVFRCGWRTWTGRPVFSQHNLNCDKHKMERFMPSDGAYFCASAFGPVTYTPCPVLVFRRRPGQNQELVAIGSMMGADADRIVVKRIILTGYPVRVHKRFATVKYMFYDPEDVKWFQPAGLTTKHGLIGNIESSVGDHGTMKCLFNAPIKQHDTVCMTLYKRVFPKYVEDKGPSVDEGRTVGTFRPKSVLDVR